MINWKKWIWPGILVVLLLTALSTWYLADEVEQDLTSKTLTGLLTNHSWATVSLNGRDLTLSGTAPSQDAVNEALEIADATYDVRTVVNATDIYQPPPIPVASPYEWGANYDGMTVVLSGFVSSADERAALVGEVGRHVPNASITDNLKIATGAPNNFTDAMSFGLSFLPKFEKGRITFKDNAFSVSGYSSSSANFADATAQISKLPAGFRIAENDIQPVGVSPYTWSASLDGKMLTLNGHIPSEQARKSMIEVVNAVFPGVGVNDNLSIAGGSPSKFEAATRHGFEMLKLFESGKVTLTDNQFSVNGLAKSLDDYDAALAASKKLPEGISARAVSVNPVVVSPYRFGAIKSEDSITLDGHMPSNAFRAVALSAARKANPSVNIIDNTRIASGVTPGLSWADATGYALKILGNFKTGSVSINDGKFSIEGEAISTSTFEAADGILAAGLGGGMELASKQITAPIAAPYLWMVNKYGSTVTVAGHISDRASGDAIIEMVKKATGVDAVSDLQGVAAGKPDGFDEARNLATGIVGRLEASEAILSNKTLTLTGHALTATTRNEVLNAISNSLPDGFTGEAKVTLQDSNLDISAAEASGDNCQNLLNSSMANGKIEFEVNRAVIKPVSAGLLDELVNNVASCPNVRIEIAGHTDADGRDGYNQKLSEGRAIAVREYLIRAGVIASRLDARGYGESRPVGDNNTDEGKARNRRIEFNVIQ